MFLEIVLDSPAISILLTILIKVLLWSLIISTPFIVAILVLYLYRRYKKWSNTEDKEQERIILGRAKKITQYDEELSRQDEAKKKLELEIDLLNIRKKSLQEELGVTEEENQEVSDASDEPSELSSMNIKQLRALAKKHGIKRYSKLSKQQLLDRLKNINITSDMK